MINRKIITSMLTIVMAFAVMTGGTMAYFTATADSASNTLTAGTLSINVSQENTYSTGNTRIASSAWLPGETVTVPLDVKNTGTVPINIKGNATGTWGNDALNGQNKVIVTEIDYWNGSAWVPMGTGPFTGDFYYSSDGKDDVTLATITPGATQQFQIKVQLASDAGNDFQGATFAAIVHVDAKQIEASTF